MVLVTLRLTQHVLHSGFALDLSLAACGASLTMAVQSCELRLGLAVLQGLVLR